MEGHIAQVEARIAARREFVEARMAARLAAQVQEQPIKEQVEAPVVVPAPPVTCLQPPHPSQIRDSYEYRVKQERDQRGWSWKD